MKKKENEKIIEICIWGVLLLSLECVLEGLISGGEIRGWVFHAVAVVVSLFAAIRRDDLTSQISMISGLVAFLNEFLLFQDTSIALKYLVPSFVLFGVSATGLVFQLGIGPGGTTPSQRLSGLNVSQTGFPGGTSSPPPIPKNPGSHLLAPPPATKQTSLPSGRASDLLSVVGGLAVIYSLSVASWIDLEKWFGLRTATVGFGELREVESIIDGVSIVSAVYFSVGFLGSFMVSALAIGAVLLRRTQFSIENFRPSRKLLGLAPLFGIWHTALVLDLSQDGGNNLMSAGGWAGTFGFLLIAIGSFFNR